MDIAVQKLCKDGIIQQDRNLHIREEEAMNIVIEPAKGLHRIRKALALSETGLRPEISEDG